MAKTKLIPFDNKATETDISVFEWTLKDTSWKFDPNEILNLKMWNHDTRTWLPLVKVKTLNDGALFAEGFVMGRDFHLTNPSTNQPEGE